MLEDEVEEILKLSEDNPQRLAAKCIVLTQQLRQLKDEQIALGRYIEEKTGGKHAVMYYNYVKEEE